MSSCRFGGPSKRQAGAISQARVFNCDGSGNYCRKSFQLKKEKDFPAQCRCSYASCSVATASFQTTLEVSSGRKVGNACLLAYNNHAACASEAPVWFGCVWRGQNGFHFGAWGVLHIVVLGSSLGPICKLCYVFDMFFGIWLKGGAQGWVCATGTWCGAEQVLVLTVHASRKWTPPIQRQLGGGGSGMLVKAECQQEVEAAHPAPAWQVQCCDLSSTTYEKGRAWSAEAGA